MSQAYPSNTPYDPYPKDQSNLPPYPPPNYQQAPPPQNYGFQGPPPPQNYGYQAPPPPPHGGYDDGDFGNMRSFSEVAIRHAFIRKVYAILTVQLAITCGFIAMFVFLEPVKGFFYANSWLLWVVMGFSIALVCVLACFDNLRRQHPWNLIILFAFTLLESILLGAISATYKTESVLMAAGITAIVVIGITVFAFQTKIDFTGMGVYLFVAILVLMGFGLLCAIIRNHYMNIVYASLGAGLFSMYLVFDTQLMLGGKHKYSISPEEHVLAALNLYLDIINLFLMILRLVGSKE